MANKSKFITGLEFAVAKALVVSVGIFPRLVSLKITSALAWAGYLLLGRLRRVGMQNLRIAFPEMDERSRTLILKGTFENLARVLGEVSHFHKTTPTKLARIVDFELDEETKTLYARKNAEGRGVMIVTGHLGNWELLVMGFAALHEPISYLARPLDNPLIEEMTVKMRTRFGNRPINKTHSAMPAIKVLREGGILGILADVNAHPKEGVFVPFFGVQACTPAGAAMIAIRSNAWIYPTFCIWNEQEQKYKIVHGELIEPANTGDRKQDIITTTEKFTAEIEKVVRRHPEQWMWIHKRWKTRPPGEPKIYD